MSGLVESPSGAAARPEAARSEAPDGLGLAGRPRTALGACLVTGGLAALTGVYFWPILSPWGTLSLGGDLAAQAYPWRLHITREMFQGRLPHWAPELGFGFPLLADSEANVFYPIAVLVSLLAGPELPYRALQFQLILHYVVAGLGMFLLLRRIRTGCPAALLGAVTFMLSGFLWAHGSHLTVVEAASWGPWALWGAAALAEGVAWRAAVGAGVALALAILGGHPQMPYYILLAFLVAVAIAGWHGARGSPDRAYPRALAGRAAAGLLLAAGLTAVQLVPTAVLSVHSIRWKPTASFLLDEALPARKLVTLVIPLAFHGTADWVSVDELHGYVGILPLVLALWALRRPRHPWVTVFGALAGLGLLVALGLPGIQWLGSAGVFRVPARAIYLFDLGVAGLAALGLHALLRAPAAPEPARERRATAVVAGLGLAASAVGAWLALAGVPAVITGKLAADFPAQYGRFLALLLGALVLVELGRRLPALRPALGVAALGLLVLDLLSLPRWLAWSGTPPDGYWPPRGDLAAIARDIEGHRVLNSGAFGRSEMMEANIGLIYGLPLTSVYSSLALSRHEPFVSHLLPALGDGTHHVADLMAVRYVVGRRGLPAGEARAPGPAFAGLHPDLFPPGAAVRAGEFVWEIPDALPRAYLSGELRVIRSKRRILEALEMLDPRETAIADQRDARCPRRSRRSGEVRFLDGAPDRLRLAVRADEAGPMVLSDTYYPGWRATVDGTPAQIYRANFFFRAICVPAGPHTVEFAFRPLDFYLGGAISLLSLGIAGALLRRPPPAPAGRSDPPVTVASR